MTSIREGAAISKKQLALRDALWPGAQENVWDRKANKGFATIPKTMPLILRAMDEMTKGAPLSSTYLSLWCATWDNGFVSLSKRDDLIYSAGFGGQRSEHTWAARLRKLEELKFIGLREGKSGPLSYAIIWNPHYAIRWNHDVAKTPGLTEATFTALLERAMELGAADMMSLPSANASPPPSPAEPLS